MKRGQPAHHQDGDIFHRIAMREPVVVPQDVFQGIDAVRKSGVTNMLDRSEVANWAAKMGYAEATEWIMKSSEAYSRGVFSGFVPTSAESQEE